MKRMFEKLKDIHVWISENTCVERKRKKKYIFVRLIQRKAMARDSYYPFLQVYDNNLDLHFLIFHELRMYTKHPSPNSTLFIWK